MGHTLESYKVFPYIAWALVVGFALFTYLLTVRVSEEISGIGTNIQDLEMRIERLEQAQPAVPAQ